MSYINALETFRVYFYFEAALPFLGENIAKLHTAVFRALFYGKILDPIVLFVVPIYRGKLQQLIKIYNEENPNNRQLQQIGIPNNPKIKTAFKTRFTATLVELMILDFPAFPQFFSAHKYS